MELEKTCYPEKTFAIPPAPLNVQLEMKRSALRIARSQLAEMAGVSAETIRKLEDSGRGSLAMFCKVMTVLDLRLDVRSWDYQTILPLDATTDSKQLCRALKAHRSALFHSGLCWYPWGDIPANDRITVEWAEPQVTLRQFSKFVRFVGASARLVKA